MFARVGAIMRRLLGCLGLVLAVACGGTSSGGGSVAPAGGDGGAIVDGGTISDGGSISDGGAVPAQPDAGAHVADAGTPPTPDGGTTTTPPDAGTFPPADGGTASACEGLAPSRVGPPSGTHAMTLGSNDDLCQTAANGSGALAFSLFNGNATALPEDNRTDFLAPDGTARGSRQRGQPSLWSHELLGRLSNFLDLEKDGDSASAGYLLAAQDDRGNLLQATPAGTPRALVEDPLGGAMVASYDASDANLQGPLALTSFDENGAQRFRVVLSANRTNFATLAVDRQGNALIVTFAADNSLLGQWVSHDGAQGPVFTLLGPSGLGLNELANRVGGGFFFRRGHNPGDDWWQLDSLSTTVSPGPAWLKAVTSRPGVDHADLFMARNGRAYAVVALRMGQCADEVELFAPDGESCGKATFPPNTPGCNDMQVGYDGTLLQQAKGCSGTTCTCSVQWWTGFFH